MRPEKGFDCAWPTAGAQKTSSTASAASPSSPLEHHTALGTDSKSESESRSVVSDSLRPHGQYSLWNSPGQNTGILQAGILELVAIPFSK